MERGLTPNKGGVEETRNPSVDAFVDCWEADYRTVLTPGFLRNKMIQHQFPFRKLCITVNNVNNELEARRLADNCVARGDADEIIFVKDALPEALALCGLAERSLGPVRHFTDFLLVTVSATDADFVFHCSSNVTLSRPFDWITEATQKLLSEKQLVVANPSWDEAGPAAECILHEYPYYIGYGFSDQCFLVKRAVFAAPIYEYRHEASLRYPMAELGRIFEMRVDSFMRCNQLLRLTDERVFYIHPSTGGSTHVRRTD